MNKKLYWTDAGDRDLEVYDPRTGFRKVIFQFGATTLPRAIIVDPSTKYDTELEWIPISYVANVLVRTLFFKNVHKFTPDVFPIGPCPFSYSIAIWISPMGKSLLLYSLITSRS